MGDKPAATFQVRVWEEEREIPTYGIGKPDKNPMFLEKRVYQGSSGKVYPYPVVDKIDDQKKLQPFHIICLENAYLYLEIMPQVGGRVYRALDKTNKYDFVYYNQVMKPALVGLAGPWVSGGIEFNWPQHHRPNTYGPVDYTIKENTDGSKTVWVGEIDRMYGTKMTAGLTLYPEKAYLEIQVQLYNRTPLPQTFLWWANPAVPVNDYTQSIFPPDVHAVFDHGRRDVSRFPIATGTYYKMDYSTGVDISWYKNIPVPTSYMAYHSDYDFVGGYDNARQAGLLHVANHHISPGKKQWTWGSGEFGKAWDRNLTDQNGPYVELMAGIYTDNQPDFSWLQPYEEKSFKQYFMPYKEIGVAKNATIDAALSFEVDLSQHTSVLQVYATSTFIDAVVEMTGKRQTYLRETVTISPTKIFSITVSLDAGDQPHDLFVQIKDACGKSLVSYRPEAPKIEKMPSAARALPAPEELKNNEALYLAGLHLEQYRHATFQPEWYYQEGLKRDPADIRLNVAYGTLLLRRGLFHKSTLLFRTAIESMSRHNANPYESEAYYQLGLALKMQGKLEEAFSVLYKSVWSAAYQDSGYFTLAQIACTNNSYAEALELVERSLIRNSRNYQARHLKGILLRKLGYTEEALALARETIRLDKLNIAALYECYLLYQAYSENDQADTVRVELVHLLRDDIHTIIALACDYMHSGLCNEAVDVFDHFYQHEYNEVYPMACYYLGHLYELLDQTEAAHSCRQRASKTNTNYCFPNSLDDLIVLESALQASQDDALVHYYLGNLFYDKKRYEDAIKHWEAARVLDDRFPTVHRNLALSYYNVLGQPAKALTSLEQAFACGPADARVLYELDQLYKKLNYSHDRRLAYLEAHWHLVIARDDLYLEYITLLNLVKQHCKALSLLTSHIFHPWEGGEGKVTGQYMLARVEIGKTSLQAYRSQEAIETLEQAMVYPQNLGEGKLAGTQENNVHYYLGCAYEQIGESEKSLTHFQLASQGSEEPASVMFYNDQPPDMLFYQGLSWQKLGDVQEASRRFNKLIDYGERHLFDTVKIDYFAVSLPNFLVFDDDLNKRNKIHCLYMMGLGHLGLQAYQQARIHFSHILELDVNHQGALIHLELCPS